MSGMVSFRVRRPYFEAIRDGTKTVEVRRHKPHWVKAMNRAPREAVFVCGGDVHRRTIRVALTAGSVQAPAVQACLPPAMRDKVNEDVGEGEVIAFYLGPEIKRKRASMILLGGPAASPPKYHKKRRSRGRKLRQAPIDST